MNTKPAFPIIGHQCEVLEIGLTIRDYFAARAFERLVQAHIDQSIDDLSKTDIANEAYSYADAMMTRRISA